MCSRSNALNDRCAHDREPAFAQSVGQGQRGQGIRRLMTTAQPEHEVFVDSRVGLERYNATAIRGRLAGAAMPRFGVAGAYWRRPGQRKIDQSRLDSRTFALPDDNLHSLFTLRGND